jgi:hypothetical protein
VFEDPSDYIQVHDASGHNLQVPLQRRGGLIWLDTEPCRSTVSAMQADTSTSKQLMHLRLGHRVESTQALAHVASSRIVVYTVSKWDRTQNLMSYSTL